MQSQAAVDDAQRYHEPAVPQMEMGPNLPPSELLESSVVDETKHRLEEESY